MRYVAMTLSIIAVACQNPAPSATPEPTKVAVPYNANPQPGDIATAVPASAQVGESVPPVQSSAGPALTPQQVAQQEARQQVASGLSSRYPIVCVARLDGSLVCTANAPGYCYELMAIDQRQVAAGIPTQAMLRRNLEPLGVTRWTCDGLVFYPR